MRIPFLALTLVVALAGGATGQIRVEAEDAAGDLDEAVAALDAAAVERAVVLDDLMAAVAAWDAVVADQTELAFAVADLRNDLAAAEHRLGELRSSIRARVVESYMSSGNALTGLLSAKTPGEVAATEILYDSINRAADDDAIAIAGLRQDMEALRADLASQEDDLANRSDEVAVLVDELDILFAEAGEDVAEAHLDLLAADERYREAFALLQQMIELQRSSGPGIERWRPIVEHYFPAEYVEQALEVMWCESRGNPKATHPLSDAAGLFQFMEQTWGFVSPRAGFDGASRYDPEANIASAAWLLEFTIDRGHPRGDWGRWTCQPLSG